MKPEATDIWVLAGQSNMQGCGMLSQVSPAHEGVWCLSSAGEWQPAAQPLHRLWESYTPVHQDLMRPSLPPDQAHLSNAEIAVLARENPCGSGLGVAFGNALAAALSRPIGLVPSAHGGTNLNQWDPALASQGGASLYGAMLDRIRRVGGRPRGVLWYQGESDALPEFADSYGERMEQWIAALRKDLNAPELPVIMVQIGRVVEAPGAVNWIPKCWDAVREALLRLPERVPHTAVVTAVDLGLVDTIHIDTPGLERLGRRIANEALHLLGHTAPTTPRLQSAHRIPDHLLQPMAELTFTGVTGGWRPRHHLLGFAVTDAAGRPHPGMTIVNVDAAEVDPTRLRVLLTGESGSDLYISYACGLNPQCNVTDEADMALCAFGPRPVQA